MPLPSCPGWLFCPVCWRCFKNSNSRGSPLLCFLPAAPPQRVSQFREQTEIKQIRGTLCSRGEVYGVLSSFAFYTEREGDPCFSKKYFYKKLLALFLLIKLWFRCWHRFFLARVFVTKRVHKPSTQKARYIACIHAVAHTSAAHTAASPTNPHNSRKTSTLSSTAKL